MNWLIIKVVLTFFYLSILVRPVLPTIYFEINKLAVNASSIHHSWLVQQLLNQVECEKNKFAEAMQTNIETTTLALPFSEEVFAKFFIVIKNKIMIRTFYFIPTEIQFSIFHPPRI